MRPCDRAQATILAFQGELTANALLPDPRKPHRAVRAIASMHGMRQPAVIPPVPPLPEAPAVEPVRSELFVPATPRTVSERIWDLVAWLDAASGRPHSPSPVLRPLADLDAVIAVLAGTLLNDDEDLKAAA